MPRRWRISAARAALQNLPARLEAAAAADTGIEAGAGLHWGRSGRGRRQRTATARAVGNRGLKLRLFESQIGAMSSGNKISTAGGESLGQNPFGALSATGLPAAPKAPASGAGAQSAKAAGPAKNRGRVDIKRTTAGRGGKTVTLVTGFVGIGLPEKEQLAKKMRNACGCGGTVKDGDIEIQGDQRDKIAAILTEAGFRPVFAGG